MSAKELGMIHTVNVTPRFTSGTDDQTYTVVDLPGQLTEQLQRLIRQGQYFKLAGIDMALHGVGGTNNANVSGLLRYFAPTKGRCAAYRAAFKAMAEAMKVQGITMRDNRFYDFRCTTRSSTTPDVLNALNNIATFDGVNELALTGAVPNGVFEVHNSGVFPQTAPADADFSEGFGVFGNAGNDFVLNEGQQGYKGTDGMIAEQEFEEIPFTVSFDADGTTGVQLLQWRPDPALYLAVMCGLFEIYVDTIECDGGTQVDLECNFMIAGWKSIMGNPDKKKRRSRRMTHKKK